MKIDKTFYLNDDVTHVAKELIGKVLCTNVDGILTSGLIVETEAYSYLEKACHAYDMKKTKRTETLFMAGGTVYVYLCYGIHHLFNVVTNRKGLAEAVLIRAVEPIDGMNEMKSRRGNRQGKALTSGPGKLSQALGIHLDHDKLDLSGDQIWIEDRNVEIDTIVSSCRIGVGYAGKDANLKWRYELKGNDYVSKGKNSY